MSLGVGTPSSHKFTVFTLLKAATVVAALLLVAVVFVRTAWIGDDAFITFRTIDQWLQGHGPRWNVSERVQAYSHPLWFLLLTPLSSIVGTPYFAALLAAFTCTIGTAALLATGVAGGRPAAVALTVVVLLTSNAFVDYSSSGLENPLTNLLLVVFLIVWWRLEAPATRAAGPLTLTLVAALLLTNRLDNVFLIGPALAVTLVRLPWPAALRTAVVGMLPFALWEIVALFYYGFPAPNPVYAKLMTGIPAAELFTQGLAYVRDSITFDRVTLLVVAVAILAAPLGRGRARDWWLAVGLVLHLAYVVKVGGDFMSGRFFAAPFVVAAAMVVHRARDVRPGIALAAAVCVALVAGATPRLALLTDSTYEVTSGNGNGIQDERGYYYRYAGLRRRDGAWRAPFPNEPRITPTDIWKGHTIAVQDVIGAYGYQAPLRLHIVDVFGLAEPLLARLPQLAAVADRTFLPATPGRLPRFTRVRQEHDCRSCHRRLLRQTAPGDARPLMEPDASRRDRGTQCQRRSGEAVGPDNPSTVSVSTPSHPLGDLALRLFAGLVSLAFLVPIVTMGAPLVPPPLHALVWTLLVLTAISPGPGLVITAGLLPIAGPIERLFDGNGINTVALIIVPFVCATFARTAWRPPTGGTLLGRPAAALALVVATSYLAVVLPGFRAGSDELWATLTRQLTTDYAGGPFEYSLRPALTWLEVLALAAGASWTLAASPAYRTPVLRAFLVGGAAFAVPPLVRLAEIALRNEHPWSTAYLFLSTQRIQPYYRDINAAGSTYALLGAVLVWLALSGRLWPWLGALLTGLSLWLTRSRAALAAMAVALVLVWITTRRASPGVWTAAAVTLVAITTVIVLSPAHQQASSTEAVGIRAELARLGLQLAYEHPLLGVGPGRFREALARLVTPELVRRFPQSAGGENAHNNFIQIVAEFGVIGFAAFLWLLARPATATWRRIRSRTAPPALLGLASGVMAFLVSCMAGHPFLTDHALVLFVLALSLTAAFAGDAPLAVSHPIQGNRHTVPENGTAAVATTAERSVGEAHLI